ncbi:M3 family metallopeptidase [Chromobacterium sp. IIBBL 290-4]|uniref:M3 family metallopeptidase n=1 Tax=Chromobacterium sp. IIBBL 290-4 TaxID=2953890 RepID=UPI0020B8DE4B|nr:M3 family metallopeptidase [Chromobacterium sp. IIBBL 290-4]UTH72727.1 M3 family metallopeptidase [Chromobacterium sp. IIBBL 290-4]
MDNPLLQAWDTPHQLPPFDRIRAEHFAPALEQLMAEHRQAVDDIARQTEPATFANTLEALESAALPLSRVALVFQNLCASHSSPELRAAERDLAPKLAAHHSAIYLNETLFARLDAVAKQAMELELDAEARRLLQRLHRDFTMAGACLQGEARRGFSDAVAELARLSAEFGQNVLADEAEYALQLRDEAELAGLPAALRASMAEAARQRGLEGHAATLAHSSATAFLAHASRADLREAIWRAKTRRGSQAGRDNRPLLCRILQLRQKQARLLGYANYADYALTDRMAGEPQAVYQLLEQVWEPAKALFEREKRQLQALARKLGLSEDIKPWDWRYLAEKVRLEHYALDDAQVKPYFSLESMQAAMFDVAGRLFCLSFEERHDLPRYHADVRTWEVSRHGQLIGIFLSDHFARPSKKGGAWNSIYRAQGRHGGISLPIVVNNTNFAKGAPTLLSFDDARTLFHEFGHALHCLLSDVRYPRLAGSRVPRDYVELPSQLMENWVLAPGILDKHARHVETGAAIPPELVAKILAAQNFQQGHATVRYAISALLDLALHQQADGIDDPDAFEAELCRRYGLPPEAELAHSLPHFNHLFNGGYAAGYYVYLWAEVLEAEAFAAFEEAGDLFDPELADKLHRHIYSAGDAREQRAAFRAFRGHEPQAQAMLKKRGLI